MSVQTVVDSTPAGRLYTPGAYVSATRLTKELAIRRGMVDPQAPGATSPLLFPFQTATQDSDSKESSLDPSVHR